MNWLPRRCLATQQKLSLVNCRREVAFVILYPHHPTTFNIALSLFLPSFVRTLSTLRCRALPLTRSKMPVSSTTQRKALGEFTLVTHTDKGTATTLLKDHNWDVQAAVNE